MSHFLYSLKKLERTVSPPGSPTDKNTFFFPVTFLFDWGEETGQWTSPLWHRARTKCRRRFRTRRVCVVWQLTGGSWYLQDCTPPSAGLFVTQCITRGSAVFIRTDKVLALNSPRRYFGAFLIFLDNYSWSWTFRNVITWTHCTKEADILVLGEVDKMMKTPTVHAVTGLTHGP